uniref:Uncharacterized protein n=1 Tax=Leersia perrieri TaxID=77586 RepID=A0A0D9WND8_9ORYZ
MEVESAECECCELREDCTRGYIVGVKADFGGLCSEVVRDEAAKLGRKRGGRVILLEAMRDHMSFCGKCRKNPAFRVADGMRQMLLRRRS